MTTINRYNKLGEYMGDNTMDMDADTFTLALMTASHTFTATNTVWADVSANEIASANGYTTPGQNLTTPTWVESAGTVTFDAVDVTWNATGAGITSTDAVLYDNTPAAPLDPLMYSIDFEGSQTAGAGTDFKVTWDASGIFTLS